MFNKKFSEEMLNIKATDESKAKLLEKIKTEQKLAASLRIKKTAKKKFIASMAAVLAIAIVSVSVFKLPVFKSKNFHFDNCSEELSSVEIKVGENVVEFPGIEHKKGIPATVNHSQIYDLFSAIYQVDQLRSIYTSGAIEDDMGEDLVNTDENYTYYSEEAETEIAEDVALKGTNSNNVKPGGAGDDQSEEKFSTTNTQVTDVDEADIIKTDGKYVYTLNSREFKINIAKAQKGELSNIATITLQMADNSEDEKFFKKYYNVTEMDMYLSGERLLVIYEKQTKNENCTVVKIFDVSKPESPVLVRELSQSGGYLSSRVVDGKLYIFTNEYFYGNPDKNDKSSYLPCTTVKGEEPQYVQTGCIYMFDGEVNRSYLTVSSVDVKSVQIIDTKTALGGGQTLYANTKNFYVTADASGVSYLTGSTSVNYDNKTRVMRFALDDGKITAMAEGSIEGTPLNQFSMDEHNDYFRIVTTKYEYSGTVNSVYILDKEVKTVGKITNIAKGERVYSVRFMGDVGYFVTFRQTDPLFAVDLSNPKEPKILSALKIPGFSNYLHPWGEGLLLGIGSDADVETGATGSVKLSMFDVSDPKNVSEKSKELVDGYYNPEIGSNHKAILADYNKNLIGFATRMGGSYYLYSYSKEKGFEVKDVLEVVGKMNTAGTQYNYSGFQNVRGIYIGDYFYVCSEYGIISYKLSDFSEVDRISY